MEESLPGLEAQGQRTGEELRRGNPSADRPSTGAETWARISSGLIPDMSVLSTQLRVIQRS